jgi:SAM-dependent methyltransferase
MSSCEPFNRKIKFMNSAHAASPSLSLDVYWPMMASAALITAGELGVFVALGQGPLLVEELAQRVGASLNGTDKLCAVLVQTGYLERTPENQLRNSPHAQAWLSQTGEQDMNSGLRWFAQAWQIMSGLREAVVNGRPKTVLWDLMQTNPGMGPAFAAFMKDYAASVVDEVQRAIELPTGAKTLLDVGGSHGLHAAAFCRRHAELCAVIYDLPVSLTNTRNLIAGWGLSDRLRCVEGDIVKDSITGTFDVITYFLVAHNHTDADNAQIVRKMAAALNPGGVLFVYEYAHDPAARFTVSSNEALASAFDLTLLVETGTHMHAAERIQAWLRDAGLTNLRRADLPSVEKGSVFSARKP